MTTGDRIKIKEFGDDGRPSERSDGAAQRAKAAAGSEASARLAEPRPETPDPAAIKPKIREFGEPAPALRAPEQKTVPAPSRGGMKIVEFDGAESTKRRETEAVAEGGAPRPHVSSSKMKIREFEGETARPRPSARSGAKDMKIVEFD